MTENKTKTNPTPVTHWYNALVPNLAFWILSMIVLTAIAIFSTRHWSEQQVEIINSKKNIKLHRDMWEHHEREWASTVEDMTRTLISQGNVILAIKNENSEKLTDELSTIYNFNATKLGIHDMMFINTKGQIYLSLANPSKTFPQQTHRINNTYVTQIKHISIHHYKDDTLTLVIPITTQENHLLGWVSIVADQDEWLEEFSEEVNRHVFFKSSLGLTYYADDESEELFDKIKMLPSTSSDHKTLDNRHWQIYNSPLESGGHLYVAYEITEEHLTEAAVQQKAIAISAAVIIILFFSGITIFSRKLKPIKILANVMRDIQNTGNFKQRLAIKGSNEISELTYTFNEMSAKISQQIHSQVETNRQLKSEILHRKNAEDKRMNLQQQLIDQSREAGKAEVANNILHNVGNVLNSVNISADQINNKLTSLQTANVMQISALLDDHKDDLDDFFRKEGMPQHIAKFLSQLSTHLHEEKENISHEIHQLKDNIEHIKHIITMQQDHSKNSHICESISPEDLFETALQLSGEACERKDIHIIKNFYITEEMELEKHKILQILVNFIRNAIYAARKNELDDSTIILTTQIEDGFLLLKVSDNGIGMEPKTVNSLFKAGFTTKKTGHGYGLHASANSAQEMQGTLSATSDGLGKGSTFTLKVPVAIQVKNAA